MKRRNRVGLGAIAVAALIGLAGCAGSSPAATHTANAKEDRFAGQTLTVLVAAAGAGQASQYSAYDSALSAAFTAATGATLKFETYSNASQENSIIQTSLVSGSGPDMVGYGSAAGATLAATKGFVTLTKADWAKVGGRNSWNTSTLSASGADAQHDIGIPSFSVPYVIAYNTAMFKKAGITSAPTTWDQWIADAKKVQAANPGVYGAGFDPADPTDPWKFIWSYTHQLGGALLSKNGKTALLDSKQVKTAMSFYFSQFTQDKIVPPASLTWNDAQMVSAFTAGKVAMLPIATSGLIQSAKGTPVDGHIAFAQLPSVPAGMTSRPAGGTPAASIVSGQFWAIFKYAAKNTDLALALAKVSNSQAIVDEQYNLLGWAPTTKAGIAALSKSNPESAPFLAIQKDMQATEYTPAWTTLETGLATAINKVASNVATTGQWNSSYLNAQLTSANQAAQALLTK